MRKNRAILKTAADNESPRNGADHPLSALRHQAGRGDGRGPLLWRIGMVPTVPVGGGD